MNIIDNLLDRITMYRLVFYFLIGLLCVALVLSFFSLLPYTPLQIAFTTTVVLVVCYVTNKVFSLVFEAPTNIESVYITALILALIITPTTTFSALPLLIWVSVWSMASKYIFALKKKHLFNPVAIACVLVAFGLGQSASWWVGTANMMPFVILGGVLIVRKIRRADLVISFFVTSMIMIFLSSFSKGTSIPTILNIVLLHSSLFFFAFIMLTEPLTTPPTRKLRILYGGLVGLLFAPQLHVGNIYSTPEIALVLGNILSYLVSPKAKLILTLKEKVQLSSDLYDFVFLPNKPVHYTAGQYMEWTLSHPHTDSRGNRRYFTLASSPTEDTLRLGIKFYDKGSSFKHALEKMDDKQKIVGGQLAGDFTLPHDPTQKCVFIAGGIGITPFRSIIKYLIDKNERRDIVMFFANKEYADIVYRDIFDQAERQLGIKTIYTITDKDHVPPGWTGNVGRIDGTMIQNSVPDFKERLFYLSGPHAMVTGYEQVLKELGVPLHHIKIDFFPGFV